MQFKTTNNQPKNVWRHNLLRLDNKLPHVCAPSNGTTNFGKLQAGTHMAKITSGGDQGKYRPCGIAVVKTLNASTNTVEVDDARNIFVGDVIGAYETKEAGTEGTQNATGRTVTDVDKTSATHTVTFDGAAIAVAVGEYLIVENAYITEGILDQEHDFSVPSGQTAVDKVLHVGIEGHATAANLIGHCPLNALVMQGGVIRSALLLALDATLLLGELESAYAGIKLH